MCTPPGCRPAAHPHPQQEAERLPDAFTERSFSGQLPPDTRHLQLQLQPLREEEVQEACEEPDVTDVPFTPPGTGQGPEEKT